LIHKSISFVWGDGNEVPAVFVVVTEKEYLPFGNPVTRIGLMVDVPMCPEEEVAVYEIDGSYG
jgi:hypothetical protein